MGRLVLLVTSPRLPAGLLTAEAWDLVADRAAVAGAELVGLVPESVLARIEPARWTEFDLAEDRTIESRLARLR